MLDLPFLDKVLNRAGDILDRHVRVDPVLVEKVEGVDVEPLEGRFGDLLDAPRPAIQAATLLAVGVDLEPELGGNHHLVADRRECLAHQPLVRKRAVDLGGVEECHAEVDGRPDHGHHLLLVLGRSVAEAHSHAAQPDGRDFQIAVSKFALLHCLNSALS